VNEGGRRDTLLDELRAFVDEHGLAALTIEKACAITGLSEDELCTYFDTKEELIVAFVEQDRRRLRERYKSYRADPSVGVMERRRGMWQSILEHEADMRIFFEAYGLALHDNLYREFFHGINDWLDLLRETLRKRGFAADRADALATLAIALYRGAMMDVCATHDRARVNAAMDLWFDTVDRLAD
jgi:AcrR family transcriptional regulator